MKVLNKVEFMEILTLLLLVLFCVALLLVVLCNRSLRCLFVLNRTVVDKPLAKESLTVIVLEKMTKIDNVYLRAGMAKISILPFRDLLYSDAPFRDCTSLKSLRLPDGLTKIGHSAFAGCTSLKSLRLPADLTEIMGGLFRVAPH